MGNWMLKISKKKIQSGLKTSPSSSHSNVKKVTSGLVHNPCFAGLYVQTQVFMFFSLFFSRESGNWIIKAEKLFFSKKNSTMKTIAIRQKSCQLVQPKAVGRGPKSNFCWWSIVQRLSSMNVGSASWNKKEMGKNQFGPCLLYINLYRIHSLLSQDTVLCRRWKILELLRGSELSQVFTEECGSAFSKDKQDKHSQAVVQYSCLMLSCLWEVTLISATDSLLAKEVLWAVQDAAEHTNHFQMCWFGEHIWNKWHSNIFITPLLSSTITCSHYKCSASLSVHAHSTSSLLLLWIQSQTKLCPGWDPNPALQKCSWSGRTACAAGFSPALLGREGKPTPHSWQSWLGYRKPGMWTLLKLKQPEIK